MSCLRFANGVWKVRCMMKYEYHIIGEFRDKRDAIIAYNEFITIHKLNRKLKPLPPSSLHH
jgi:hypothetical protein